MKRILLKTWTNKSLVSNVNKIRQLVKVAHGTNDADIPK